MKREVQSVSGSDALFPNDFGEDLLVVTVVMDFDYTINKYQTDVGHFLA